MDATKRILILMGQTGFGHSSAARAISDALHELYQGKCEVEILNPLNHQQSPGLFRKSQSDYDEAVKRAPELYKLGFHVSDSPVPKTIIDGALTVGLFQAIQDIVRSRQPDAIVVVYPEYLAPLAAVFLYERYHIPVITVVTDLVTVQRMWFNPVSDLCLVPTQAAAEVGVLAGMDAGKIKITGIPVSPQLSQETRTAAALRDELGWQPDLTTVLVAGSKRTRHLPEILHVLNHSGLPVQLSIVAGGDDAFYRQVQDTDWHRAAHLYNYVDNMPQLLRAADCILCKAGGLIVSEALACGLPILLADVIEGQETGNAQYVVEGGAGERADAPAQALESLCHWLEHNRQLLSQRADNARRLGRPRAAFDVAQWVWKLAGGEFDNGGRNDSLR